ncbi:eukaryotic translation initiation factor 4 gamma [Drosophila novamexicana]|uniref:eukaryotic translation initiation factor 4 gamma n=1 Tax=Drosophila novamexicana TaxID=47314 RepID=UPI0011E5D802|nr:eukaryotic translation initiation factor 4 gamma [Drosophila novamexicana]
METAKPPTSLSMLLLLLPLWVTIGSALPKRELQMLEMMQNILGVDSADLSGRSQRSSPMLFAASVPCEDSLPEDSSAQLSLFDGDFDESEECGDYGQPCHGAAQLPSGLEPCARPMLPMQHPCFVRVVLLRTPLLRHDPCTNFTLGMAQPTTTSSTTSASAKKPRGKKCRSKMRKSTPRPTPGSNSTSSSTSSATSTTELETTTTSTRPTTTSRPAETSTTERTTTSSTTARSTTTKTPSTTTTELLPTIMELDEMSTTITAPSSSTVVYTRRNKLKSLRGRRRKQQRGKLAGVPDKPTIKLDGSMQPSDTFPVFLTTEAAELRSRPKSTTLRPEALATTSTESETTTECIEASDDEETATENAESRTNEEEEEEDKETEASEDCEDAEDQDTNLCPQFSAPEEAANMRLMPSGSRFRKPVKNYVEPILYEGQFAKPRQRIGMLPPQRRDFYVSNKQIMPRPRPKLRQPLPHSIYMNNIVRGLKCSDEAGAHAHPPQPGRFLSRKPATTPQRIWLNRRNGAGYAPLRSQPSAQGPQRGRDNPLYGLSSGEDPDSYGHDSDQYYDDDTPDRLAWPRDHPLHGSFKKLIIGDMENTESGITY